MFYVSLIIGYVVVLNSIPSKKNIHKTKHEFLRGFINANIVGVDESNYFCFLL